MNKLADCCLRPLLLSPHLIFTRRLQKVCPISRPAPLHEQTLICDCSQCHPDKEASHQLDKCPLTIAALAHQRTMMSREQSQKMNIMVNRLRRVCTRALRNATRNEGSHSANNVLAASASVSKAIVDFWLKDVELQADTTHNPVSDPAIVSMMITGTTETLIALSESLLLVDSPDSHCKALQYLSRCAPILHVLPEPDGSVIRCLTSTYCNTSVALYQADKIAMAINFVRPSCELLRAVSSISFN